MSRRAGSRSVGLAGGVRRRGLGGVLRGVAVAAALSGGACDFGLVDPSESELAPARLWFDFRFRETIGGLTTGQVALHSGAGPGGRRAVPDERLWWNGAALDPDPVLSESLIYTVSGVLQGAGPVVLVEPPAVAGLAVSPDTVRITLLDVITPDTLRVVRGPTVELDLVGCCEDALSAGGGFTPALLEGTWRAVLEPDSAGVAAGLEPMVLAEDSTLQAPLVVPTEGLAPALGAGSLRLSVTMHTRVLAPDGLYEIEMWQSLEDAVPFVMLEPAPARH